MHELGCWIGAGWAHVEYVDGSFAVRPVNSVLWRTMVVVLDQELYPNQTVYVLVGARAVLGGKPFVVLASDFTVENKLPFEGYRDLPCR